MLSHLLDTSVYSQPLNQRPIASVGERWKHLGDDRLAVSIICEAEVRFGLEWKDSDALRRKYSEFLEGRLAIIPVNIEVATAFAEMKAVAKRKGRLMPDFDLLIAATAKVHRLIVATLNYRHFTGLEGVAVEDWSR